MRLLLRIGRHGFIFAAAKSAVLIAPLLAASMLTQAQYGSVEWWLALSMALGPVIGFGAPSVVAYGSVSRQLQRHVRTATVCVLAIAIALVFFAFLMPLLGRDWAHYFYGPVALQCAVVIQQMTLAARLKGTGKGAWASVAESTLYLCLLLALLSKLMGAGFIAAFVFWMVVASVLLAVGLVALVRVPSLWRWPNRNFKACLAVGWRFMLGAALMAGFMATPRIALGFLAPAETVAAFALVFRWLSISIIAHQFINTVFFAHIYGDVSERRRDIAIAIVISVVASGALLIVLFLALGQGLLPFQLPFPHEKVLFLPMAMVMVMWAMTACLEGSLYRQGSALKQSFAVVMGLSVMLLILAVNVMSVQDALLGMTYAWMGGLLVLIAVQFWRLGQHRPLISGMTFCVWLSLFITLNIVQQGWA